MSTTPPEYEGDEPEAESYDDLPDAQEDDEHGEDWSPMEIPDGTD